MFRLLLAFFLIIECECVSSSFIKNGVGCTAEENRSTATASSFKKIIDAGTTYMHNRGYSRSIRVDGAYSTIYLAGVTSTRDLYTNRSLVDDFDGQVRDVYARINQTLVEQYCSQLHDLVATTAFITNGSFGTRFAELRKEIFNGRDFSTSALITIVSLAKPEMLVEIQSIAVIPSRNKQPIIHSNKLLIFTFFFFVCQINS